MFLEIILILKPWIISKIESMDPWSADFNKIKSLQEHRPEFAH